MFPEPRRRRNRRRVILPIVLVLAVVAALVIGSRSDNTLASRDFYDLATSIAVDLDSDGGRFQEILTQAVDVDRDEYIGGLDQVAASLTEAITSVPPAEDLPVEIRGTRRLLVTTLERWLLGVEQFQAGSLLVVDFPLAAVGESDLTEALANLLVADQNYELLAADLEALRLELEIPVTSVPEVRFTPANVLSPTYLEALTSRLKAADVLAGRRSVKIINIVTSPEPLGGEGFDAERLPFTEMVDVTAVVVNEGNQPEEGLAVTLSLLNVTTGVATGDTRTIELLDSNAQEAVVFSELPVEPGQRYRVSIVAVTAVVDIDSQGAEVIEFVISENAEIPDESTTTTP